MKKKKDKASGAAYIRDQGMLGKTLKAINKKAYDTQNPEKIAPSKGKKSDSNTKQESKIKDVRTKRLADEDLYKTQEEGLAELKALREKQRKRADEFKKRK